MARPPLSAAVACRAQEAVVHFFDLNEALIEILSVSLQH